MKTSIIAIGSDILFCLISIFLIGLIILNYFLPYPVSLVYAIILSLILTFIFAKRKLKAWKSSGLKKSEQKKVDSLVLSLDFMPTQSVLALFEKAFMLKGEHFQRKKDFFVFESQNKIVYVNCSVNGLTKADVVKVYNKSDENEKIIYATHLSKDVTDFIARFDKAITLKTEKDVYELLKEVSLLPAPMVDLKLKPKNSVLIKSAFSRQKAKQYFFLGIGFLFVSYFVRIKLYYILFGTAFLLFSLACRFFAPSEQKTN